jgi:hypothetical protein
VLTVSPVIGTRALDDDTPRTGAAKAAQETRLQPDKVTLSPLARQRLRGEEAGPEPVQAEPDPARPGAAPGSPPGAGARLTEAQQREVSDLQRRDAQVRQHEMAHQAAGGDLTGAAAFTYQTGPDGRSYAIGGEVPLAARSGRTPEETIAIARRVRAAALAPSDPSSADLAAAAQAARLEMAAAQQKRQQAGGPGQAGPTSQRGAAAAPGARAGAGRPDLERLLVGAQQARPSR